MKALPLLVLAVLAFSIYAPSATSLSPQPDSMSIVTDFSTYPLNAPIHISGVIIASSFTSTGVVITTYNPGNTAVSIDSVAVNSKGQFNDSYTLGGTPAWVNGTYTIRAEWGDPTNGKQVNGSTTFVYGPSTTVSTSSTASSSSSTTSKSSSSTSTTTTKSTPSQVQVTFEVTNSSKVPLALAIVSVNDTKNTPVAQGLTASDGSLTLPLMTGNYTVLVQDATYIANQTKIAFTKTGTVPIVLYRPNEPHPIASTNGSSVPVTLSFLVKDTSGNPVAVASVTLTDAKSNPVASGLTTGTGLLSLFTTAGTYTVTVSKGTYTTYSKAQTFSGSSIVSVVLAPLSTAPATPSNQALTPPGFSATVSGGTVLNASFTSASNTYVVRVTGGANSTLEVTIPNNVYPNDFFIVSGPAPGTYDFKAPTLTVPFSGQLQVTITEPENTTPNSMSPYDIAVVSTPSGVLDEFRIGTAVATVAGGLYYGIYFQTQSTSLPCENQCIVYPYQPITDPTGHYTITFGFPVNGQTFFTIQSPDALSVVVKPYTQQPGQVTQLDPAQLPNTPYSTDYQMAADTAYDIHLGAPCSGSFTASGCYDLGALSWTLGGSGLISVAFNDLNNVPVATGAATNVGKPVLAAQGPNGLAISVEFLNQLANDQNLVRVYGTEQVYVSLLNGGQYGPRLLNLQVQPGYANCNIPNQICTVTGGLFGGYPQVVLSFPEPTEVQNFVFNVTINGLTVSQLGNFTKSGLNPAYQVTTSCGGGTTPTCLVGFWPGRAGTFAVSVFSKTFDGTYTGTMSILTQGSSYPAAIGGGIGAFGFIGGLVFWMKRRGNRVIDPTTIGRGE